MLKKFSFGLAAGAAFLFAQTAAHAADVAAPKPAPKNNTLSIEFSPEYDATATNTGLVDDYIKVGLSHSFDNNVVIGSSFQYTWRVDPANPSVDQLEGSIGYKIKNGAFTLTPTAILGYGFGDHPKINAAIATESDLYYAVTLAGDYKIDDHWTWNVFNARYRNAFTTTWITPKIATGVTYKFDSSSSIYANVGYAWKDKGTGAGLLADKWNVAIGYKFAF